MNENADSAYGKAIMEKVAAIVTCAFDEDAETMGSILHEVTTQREFVDIVAILALTMTENIREIASLKGQSTEEVWQQACLDIQNLLLGT